MICFVMTHEDFYKIYFVSAECVVISSCWWRPKFHKLLTMRQAASVSSVYNSRKGCTAQYLAGVGVSILTVSAVQKPEHLTLTFCIFGDQLNRGNSVWSSWATKAGVIILTVLPHSPLSLAEKIMQKLAFAISCLATFQFKSENSTKHQDCVADKVPKEQP